MRDVAVLEAAQHVRDRIDLADVRQELVAEPLAARGAAHQSGDVDEFELGRHDLRRFGEPRQHVEPRVRHGDAADIGLDRAERIIRRLPPPRSRSSALKSVDLPTLGRPTMPQLNPMEARPCPRQEVPRATVSAAAVAG